MHMADNILLFTDFVTLYVVFLALFRDEGEKWSQTYLIIVRDESMSCRLLKRTKTKHRQNN